MLQYLSACPENRVNIELGISDFGRKSRNKNCTPLFFFLYGKEK
jgi:hypothetical protein